jgi:hypothetical protein
MNGIGPKSLAARGAPLRISAYAVSLLKSQAASFPIVEAAIDHALTGLALYDDVGDWRADLAAGRWNAFVAELSEHPQLPEFRAGNRRQVLVKMLAQDGLIPYCARISREFRAGAALADEVDVLPLAAQLRNLAVAVEEQAAAFQHHYRDAADRATALLMRPATSAAG